MFSILKWNQPFGEVLFSDGRRWKVAVLANFLTSFLWRDGRKQNPEISYSTLVGHEFSTKICFLEVSLVLAYFYLKKMKNKFTIADLNDFSISLDFEVCIVQ